MSRAFVTQTTRSFSHSSFVNLAEAVILNWLMMPLATQTVFMSSLLKIKFVGKRFGKKPLKSITDGNDEIILPSAQSRPFYHEKARVILRNAPTLYKKVITKSKNLVLTPH